MVSKRILLASLALASLASASDRLSRFRRYQTLAEVTTSGGTETPVIGIVTQTLEEEMRNDTRFFGYKYYIMQSYVDWVQAVGARVVPLI